MDSVIAIALFVVISILLVALMAGGNDPGKDNKANKTKRGGGSPGRVVTTSTENAPLVPPSRTLPAPGGEVSPHIGSWMRTLIGHDGTPQGASGPTAGSGTSSTAGAGLSRLSSPVQVRKRGRDQEPAPKGLGSSLPPLRRGTKTGSVPPPPPPPPPPPSAPAPGQVAPAAADNEVIWYRCSLCPRGFTSSKGLCGHMRAHPYREWRGAHPPPTFSRDDFLGAPGVGPSSQVGGAEVPLAEHHTVPPETPAKASTSGTVVAENTSNAEQAGGQAGGGGGGGAARVDVNEPEQKPLKDFDLNELPPENEGSQ